MIKGEIFILTTGEYSDFGITATLRALVAFDLDEEVRAFPKPQRPRSPYDRADAPPRFDFRSHKFIEHLIAKKLAENVPLRALHLGDYGDPPSLPLGDYHGREEYADATVVGVATCIKHDDCCENPMTLGAACLQKQIGAPQ